MKLRNLFKGNSMILISIIFILTACAKGDGSIDTIEMLDATKSRYCESIRTSNDIGLTLVLLPDKSEIYLSENTEIEMMVAGNCPGSPNTSIILNRGQIAIRVQQLTDTYIGVKTPSGFVARLEDTGIVTYIPASGIFSLDCTNGGCTIGPTIENLFVVPCGKTGLVDKDGTYTGPYEIISDVFQKYGDWLFPNCLGLKTSTPTKSKLTKTPDLAATGTVFCETFSNQFPSTPCPYFLP